MAISNYLQKHLAEALLRGTEFTMPDTLALCFLKATPNPSDDGSFAGGNEVANSFNYGRIEIGPGTDKWTAYSTGHITNSEEYEVTCDGGDWGIIVAYGVTDSTDYAGGNLLFYTTITAQTITDGDTFTIGVGSLNFSLF